MPSLTVTATQGGSTGSGTFLQVLVLNNASVGSSPNQSSATFPANTNPNLQMSPNNGGLIYAIDCGAPQTGSTGVNFLQDTSLAGGNELATYVAQALGGSVTIENPNPQNPNLYGPNEIAAVEVLPSGGNITTDPSTPAVKNVSGTTTTTASFSPPAGALILVLAAGEGGAGTCTLTVSGTLLTYTQIVTAAETGAGAVTIAYAVMPPPPTITTLQLPGAAVGSAYSATLSGTSGTKPYSWSVTAGSLPAGLSLASSTGVISGTPTGSAGVSTFTVTLTDAFTFTATASFSIVVNVDSTPGGVVRATWALSQYQYSYGSLEVPVSTTDHDWLFVSVSWQAGDDSGIAYCADSAHNFYQPGGLASSGQTCTQVFVCSNARAASAVYIATSAYVRWLSVQITEVTGLQPGYVVDASNTFSGGPGTTFTESLTTANADFILAVGALSGTPQTITQSGSGATWTALVGSINGNASAGVTQSLAWAETSGAATPSMQFTGTSGYYAGVMIAVKQAGGLPVNSNLAWPITKVYAAFGYVPQEPTAPPTWTDITGRFWGLTGQRGRSFELDEIAAGDLTLALDNFDGGLSPQNTSSPYYPNVTPITPVLVTMSWQGRMYALFRGLMMSIPQTYDFQRGIVEVAISDDFSKLPQSLLAGCMIQEMLFDEPLDLWPLNDQQGAPYASNWTGLSAAELVPTVAQGGGGTAPPKALTVNLFGFNFPVSSSFLASTSSGATTTSGTTTNSTSNTPTTGFGNSQSGVYPAGLAGTQDTTWGNTSAGVGGGTTTFQGTVLVDSNDSTLPMTTTGCTYSVWAQMLSGLNSSTGAVIMALSNQTGTGSAKWLEVYVNAAGTTVTVSQTSGSHTFTPSASLYDNKWHLWTVTITTGSVVTVYLDGVSQLSYTATFPTGSPTLLQFGGDTTIGSTSSAGLFTGSMYLAGVYPRVIDTERIQTWFMSGQTGFLDELAGTRIQRILAWARWSAPQAIDPGLSLQQVFNYLTGGYASSGLTGAIGNYQTAGGSAAVDTGAQADVTAQDVANTENGLLAMTAGGVLFFRNRNNLSSFPVGLALGDMDYPLNQTSSFREGGLGEWVNTNLCMVAISGGWSYDGGPSGLLTVT